MTNNLEAHALELRGFGPAPAPGTRARVDPAGPDRQRPGPARTEPARTEPDGIEAAPGMSARAPTLSAYPKAGDLAQEAPLHEQRLADATPLAREVAEHVVRRHQASTEHPFERPAQTRVFVVANQKGGVGKTTSTVNIAAAMALRGQRVLVVDLDPQGNASTALRIDHEEGTRGVYEALVDGEPIADLVQPCPDIDELRVLPASIDLAGAEIELVSLVARESRLKRALDGYLAGLDDNERVDYVFIDCPPSLGLLTVNALVAGRELLIPIQCEYYALEGLGQLMRNITLIKDHLNPSLEVSTILLTMYDARTRLSAGVADEVRTHFDDRVLRTAIPRSVRISEAPSYQQSVLTYDPASPGSLCYLEAAREIAAAGAAEEDS